MAKSDWKKREVIIAPPETPESEEIRIPIHGEKKLNFQTQMIKAFQNAINLLADTKKVTQYSGLILCSLACELFLKAIIMKTKSVHAWGHDIHQFYFELNETEQIFLLNSFLNAKQLQDADLTEAIIDEAKDEFEDMLSLDALLFETIRYKHEYSTIAYDDWFIYNFAQNLKTLGYKLGLT